ncbi:hypothetical protein AAFF_G00111070 [Aldrovandia affinis]|uniref:Uncharacterized protein n=1 Tax=Aldrovandia affinis TaxID=143900 RepID=A0AAD7RTY1_9TELE|nr:hypothetical protein AAFF_G00111070 [Aldrovandia affinis]
MPSGRRRLSQAAAVYYAARLGGDAESVERARGSRTSPARNSSMGDTPLAAICWPLRLLPFCPDAQLCFAFPFPFSPIFDWRHSLIKPISKSPVSEMNRHLCVFFNHLLI